MAPHRQPCQSIPGTLFASAARSEVQVCIQEGRPEDRLGRRSSTADEHRQTSIVCLEETGSQMMTLPLFRSGSSSNGAWQLQQFIPSGLSGASARMRAIIEHVNSVNATAKCDATACEISRRRKVRGRAITHARKTTCLRAISARRRNFAIWILSST